MAKTMKIYDDIVMGQKLLNNQTRSDIRVPIHATANQSMENCDDNSVHQKQIKTDSGIFLILFDIGNFVFFQYDQSN